MKRRMRNLLSVALVLAFCILAGCGSERKEDSEGKEQQVQQEDSKEVSEELPEDGAAQESGKETKNQEESHYIEKLVCRRENILVIPKEEPEEEQKASSQETEEGEEQEASSQETEVWEPYNEPADVTHEYVNQGEGKLIVIDAGHQVRGNSEKEPIGPGSSEMKAKVTGGTTGTTTGLKEYELNLMVAFKLQQELEARGYQVLMVRTSHEVNISNSERAAVANNAGADAFIRLHANGSENSSDNGILTISPTPDNPYMGTIYSQCRRLSDCVLDGAVNATGAKKKYVWETDTMSGINWCTVPVTIVEMGFMTNPTEDRNMADEGYQWRMAQGIADGIDIYFAN